MRKQETKGEGGLRTAVAPALLLVSFYFAALKKSRSSIGADPGCWGGGHILVCLCLRGTESTLTWTGCTVTHRLHIYRSLSVEALRHLSILWQLWKLAANPEALSARGTHTVLISVIACCRLSQWATSRQMIVLGFALWKVKKSSKFDRQLLYTRTKGVFIRLTEAYAFRQRNISPRYSSDNLLRHPQH